MRRIRILLVALGLLLAGAIPAAASSTLPGFQMDGGRWVDTSCYGTHSYEVEVFDGLNLSGWHTKLCSSQVTFCDVPLQPYTTAYIMSSCNGTGDANDKVSSINVYWNNHPALCFYKDRAYTGGTFAVRSVVPVRDGIPFGITSMTWGGC